MRVQSAEPETESEGSTTRTESDQDFDEFERSFGALLIARVARELSRPFLPAICHRTDKDASRDLRRELVLCLAEVPTTHETAARRCDLVGCSIGRRCNELPTSSLTDVSDWIHSDRASRCCKPWNSGRGLMASLTGAHRCELQRGSEWPKAEISVIGNRSAVRSVRCEFMWVPATVCTLFAAERRS